MKTHLQGIKFGSASVLSIGILTMGQALAEEIGELEHTVIEGDSSALIVITDPGVEEITGRQIEVKQPDTLGDLFKDLPGAQVSGGYAADQKLYLRGVEDKFANISVDGVVQGGYLNYHSGQLSVEPEMLKSVSVGLGAGSALNGPGALAGAVMFETKNADDMLAEGEDFGGYLKAGYGSGANSYFGAATVYGRINEDWSFLGSLTYRDNDDYRAGNGETIDYTASQQWQSLLKINGQLNAQNSVEFSYEHNELDGIFRYRPHLSQDITHPSADNRPGPQVNKRDTLSAKWRHEGASDWLDLTARAYLNTNSITRVDQFRLGYQSYGIDLRNTADLQDHHLVFGAELRRDDAKQHILGPNINSDGDENWPTQRGGEELEIIGLYAQDEWQISERWRASYGGRVDLYDYTDRDGKNFTDIGPSGNVTLSYSPLAGLDINATAAHVFRGVQPMEVVKFSRDTMNSDDLSAETADKIELGAVWQSDSGFFAKGAIYKQRINDVILFEGDYRVNGGELDTQGYEMSFGWMKDNFNVTFGLEDARPELNGEALQDDDFGLGTTTGRTWRASTSYMFEDQRLLVGWSMRFVESVDDVPEDVPAKDSYFINDCYAEWRPWAEKDITLNLTVNNVFDEYYYDHGTWGMNSATGLQRGFAERGRDITLSATYKF